MTVVKLPDDNEAVLKESDDLTNKEVKIVRRIARKANTALQKVREAGLVSDEDAPKDETEDQKRDRNLKAIAAFSALSDDEEDSLDEFQRECVVLRLRSWTLKNEDGLDRPFPKNADEVDDLPRSFYTPLTKEASDLNLNEDFSIDEGLTDPKVDTTSSVD
jgi:hypothetical protein